MELCRDRKRRGEVGFCSDREHPAVLIVVGHVNFLESGIGAAPVMLLHVLAAPCAHLFLVGPRRYGCLKGRGCTAHNKGIPGFASKPVKVTPQAKVNKWHGGCHMYFIDVLHHPAHASRQASSPCPQHSHSWISPVKGFNFPAEQ